MARHRLLDARRIRVPPCSAAKTLAGVRHDGAVSRQDGWLRGGLRARRTAVPADRPAPWNSRSRTRRLTDLL
jgi:hypothetical protein